MLKFREIFSLTSAYTINVGLRKIIYIIFLPRRISLLPFKFVGENPKCFIGIGNKIRIINDRCSHNN
jgi:hypothetical protein